MADLVNDSGMVFCDRHYGGINYPRGGVGHMAELMAEGVGICMCWGGGTRPKIRG